MLQTGRQVFNPRVSAVFEVPTSPIYSTVHIAFTMPLFVDEEESMVNRVCALDDVTNARFIGRHLIIETSNPTNTNKLIASVMKIATGMGFVPQALAA